MNSRICHDILLTVAAFPFAYYLLVLYSARRFFGQPAEQSSAASTFTPPVSILKPIHGLDPDAFENFASFCKQRYPVYEILFCVDGEDDPAVAVIERLARQFPELPIRVLFGSGRNATNDKVAKLSRLVNESRYEFLVISDSDVRVQPDYLRSVVAPLADPKVGAVTCFYKPIEETTFTQRLQSIGMASDFYAGILVARQLDGVKFALGPTIATTRERLSGFGGYPSIENRPADDLLVGRMIAEQGYEVRLLPYCVLTVADYQSMSGLFHKRLRWLVVMRYMRPWGHLGLVFTQGLPWSLVVVATHPGVGIAAGYAGAYLTLRIALTWIIGVRGLRQAGLWKEFPFIAVWDAVAFFIWLISFTRRSIRWRDGEYYIRQGNLVPAVPRPASE